MLTNAFRAFGPRNPAIIEMANVCAVGEGEERRADAAETALVSQALTAAGIAAVKYDYPELLFRMVAPLQEGIGPGADSYTWNEYDVVGMAKIIANYGDDLPNVSANVRTNTGLIKTIADAFEYTKQDVRRVLEARKQGRQAEVLDVDRIAEAREMIERKKDAIAFLGDTVHNLPGVLKNANVTTLTASTPGTGTDKKWTGTDKTGGEILKDLRAGVTQIRTQSQGRHTPNVIIMPIEEAEAIAAKPLVGTTENQVTVLEQFLASSAASGRPIRIIATTRAKLANNSNNGPRVMFLHVSPDVLRLVEPLPFEADAPQRVSLSFKVPCESRFGGIFIKKPLAAAYMDFV